MVIKDVLSDAKTILEKADIESFLADSLILLCFTLGITKERYIIIKNDEMPEDKRLEYLNLIEKRAKNCPVKYLTGTCEFMELLFDVEPGILIPRPETELLVEKAISLFDKDASIKAADFCCGSGCIGLSFIHFMNKATVKLFDISDKALEISERNAKKLQLDNRCEIIKKDILTDEAEEMFDIILSNPPYISTEDYNNLMDDVKLYEPEIALHSPDDEYKFYKRIINSYTKNLKEKGYLLFEVGYNQAQYIKSLILSSDEYEYADIIKDYSGIERIVFAQKKSISEG